MNFDLAETETYQLHPPPGGWILSLAFLVVSIAMARKRQAMLVPFCTAAVILVSAGTLAWIVCISEATSWDRWSLTVVEILLMSAAPTGASTLWLVKSVESRRLSSPAIQIPGALGAFATGWVVAILSLIGIYGMHT